MFEILPLFVGEAIHQACLNQILNERKYPWSALFQAIFLFLWAAARERAGSKKIARKNPLIFSLPKHCQQPLCFTGPLRPAREHAHALHAPHCATSKLHTPFRCGHHLNEHSIRMPKPSMCYVSCVLLSCAHAPVSVPKGVIPSSPAMLAQATSRPPPSRAPSHAMLLSI